MRTKAQRPKNDRSRAVLRATTGMSEARVVRKRSRSRPFPDGVSGNGTILREKTEAYLSAGAEEVWIVYLKSKRCEVHGKEGRLEHSRFPVDLADLFD